MSIFLRKLISKLLSGSWDKVFSILYDCAVSDPLPTGMINSKCAAPGMQISLQVKYVTSKTTDVGCEESSRTSCKGNITWSVYPTDWMPKISNCSGVGHKISSDSMFVEFFHKISWGKPPSPGDCQYVFHPSCNWYSKPK